MLFWPREGDVLSPSITCEGTRSLSIGRPLFSISNKLGIESRCVREVSVDEYRYFTSFRGRAPSSSSSLDDEAGVSSDEFVKSSRRGVGTALRGAASLIKREGPLEVEGALEASRSDAASRCVVASRCFVASREVAASRFDAEETVRTDEG